MKNSRPSQNRDKNLFQRRAEQDVSEQARSNAGQDEETPGKPGQTPPNDRASSSVPEEQHRDDCREAVWPERGHLAGDQRLQAGPASSTGEGFCGLLPLFRFMNLDVMKWLCF